MSLDRAIASIPWHWPRPDLSALEPEALVYWIAMNHYREFLKGNSVELSELIHAPWTVPLERWGGLLHKIPGPDRYPVFFGCLIEMARHGEKAFEFAVPGRSDMADADASVGLPDLLPTELQILGDVATEKHRIPVPRHTCIETFPRRIWARAIRPENPPSRRIIAALRSLQSIDALCFWQQWTHSPLWKTARIVEVHHVLADDSLAGRCFADRCVQRLTASPGGIARADLNQGKKIALHRHLGVKRMYSVGRALFPSDGPEPWRKAPDLACSAFVRPLWFSQREEFLPDLLDLFCQAGRLPQLYPNLSYVLQWQLFLTGKMRALEQIDHLETEAPQETPPRPFSWG